VALAALYVAREWQKYHTVFDGFRPGWVVGDPNYFCVSVVLTMPVAYCLAMSRGSGWQRLYCGGCLMICVIGFVLAASRGGFIGMIVALLVIIWHSPHRAANVALAAAIIGPLAITGPIAQRLFRPSHGDELAVNNRAESWKAGLRMIAAHPLDGVGLGQFKPMAPRYSEGRAPDYVAHNSYIEIAAEAGVPALVAFVGVLASSVVSLERSRRISENRRRIFLSRACVGIEAGLVGAAVAVFFVSGQYQKLLWLMVFLSIAASTLATTPTTRQRSGA
jgi:hypothetical protein